MARFFSLWNVYISLLVITFVYSASPSDGPAGKKVLAVLDNLRIKSTHSTFFKNIEDRGYQVTYAAASDKSVSFQKYGEFSFDHLILFAPSSKDMAGIKVEDVLSFIDNGKNVLIAGSPSLNDNIREIASQCNIEFDEEDTFVIDHLNYDVSDRDGDHTLLVVDRFDASLGGLLGIDKVSDLSPVLFRGIGQDIEEDSQVLFSILSGYPTTYSSALLEPLEDTVHVAGTKTSLATALQARNNARVAFVGSLDLFSDKLFNSPVQKYSPDNKSKKFDKSGNEVFSTKLVQWVFQERGILRVSNVTHHRVGETQAPETYTIKEDIKYSATIEEWNGKRWVPYISKGVYLEFQMLDPYVRTELQADSNGVYSTQFKLPDVYGIFTFRLLHNRKGYTLLNNIIRTPVRPFRHNQYERFIYSAYPYYASSLSMLAGLFIFSWVFLYHRETKTINKDQTR